MTISKRLASLREKKGVSLSVAAEESGVSKSNLHKMETAKPDSPANPSMEILILLAKYYDVSIDFLVGLNVPSRFLISNLDFYQVTRDSVSQIERLSGKTFSNDEILQFQENFALSLNSFYIYVK